MTQKHLLKGLTVWKVQVLEQLPHEELGWTINVIGNFAGGLLLLDVAMWLQLVRESVAE